ncbi:MAG: hypothetical protein GFH27_549303n135 [Chloroflexi bacterium AL-W]|nr:hypothetical protein [Chloroflexi bacterium AL-N1]NOK68020.1 hypothetical protein [Chloroflexi bacterium AL-N10]NOK73360.1 hypothetical protein [Chloroflexi bacterium AL-N5]NOK83274.1 hypothetical protein [Chloroflexi bacterium AL-W]NOK87691.1 hypothetical protein [Chloroflexi bacterium AL-N15]
MPYAHMNLVCRQCGEHFVFTAGEQEYYAEKGLLNEPTRCPRCRGLISDDTSSSPKRDHRPSAHRDSLPKHTRIK